GRPPRPAGRAGAAGAAPLRFPLPSPPTPSGRESTAMTDQTGQARTILIVDDDRELSDGLRAVLERQGHRVLQATNGMQAKDVVYQQHPDLVILDMMMPRMGGFPVLEHFRDKTDAPPIIMITAN